MNKRERLLTAMRGKRPDMVPICPDISNMYPCKYADRPFWDVQFYGEPSKWKMQIDLSRKFDFEILIGIPGLSDPDRKSRKSVSVLEKTRDHLLVEEEYRTSTRSLSSRIYYPRDKSPWTTKALITDIPEDLSAVRELFFTDPREMVVNEEKNDEIREYLGDGGLEYVGVSAPTNWWLGLRRPELEEGILDWFVHKVIMDTLMEEYTEWALEYLEHVCRKIRPPLVNIGGSRCSLSLISPELYRRYNLPYMSRATEICKEHGVLTRAHICGRSNDVLEMLALDSDLDIIDPLESPPGGDVNLQEVKKRFGSRLVLSGNVNTFATLARGTPDMVIKEVKECMRAAAPGGGYILATGDQVPCDCPEENFKALIEAGREYGKYPIRL